MESVKTLRDRPTRSEQEQKMGMKKEWSRPVFKNLRLGFEITMYFWTR